MLTIEEAKQRTEAFLVGQMLEALRAVDYEVLSFDAEPRDVELSDMSCAGVRNPPCSRRIRRGLSRESVR
jgi:hypothetical protein